MLGFLTVLVEAHIIKRELTKPVKSDALHEASRNDAVSVNVRTGNENTAAGDEGNWIKCHEN
jgi:hypothetical protein